MKMATDFGKLVLAALCGILLTACVSSPEDLAARQARSVHLYYGNDPDGLISAAAATVTVRESYDGSYFAALVWDAGYCGIQDHIDGTRAIIFSVWDPVDPYDFTAKPDEVEEYLRAKIVYSAPEMSVDRFGGEGSGVRTMAGFAWRENKPFRFKVECEPYGDNRMLYTCYVKDGEDGGFDWFKLASISTVRHPERGAVGGLGTLNSFVEDFMRNGESAKQARRAEFSDVEVFYQGEWHQLTRAMFTGDSTPSLNVDAGKIPETGAFFLATGGATTNATTELWQFIE